MPNTTCTVPNCNRNVTARGYCTNRCRDRAAAPAGHGTCTCTHCGTHYDGHPLSRYCSTRCADRAALDRGTSRSTQWITAARRAAIYQRDGFTCYLCGCELDTNKANVLAPNAATLDHVIPRAKGGSDDSANLRACCRACNSAKSDHDLETFKLKLAA